ncbi:MAG: hypothetical protein SGPRY_012785, partial [Prymnesium sp.]
MASPNCTASPPPSLHSRGRDRSARESLSLPRLRLAIATLFVPNQPCSGVGCGLLFWCQGAQRLSAALPSQWESSLLAVHGPPFVSGSSSMAPGASWCSQVSGRMPMNDTLDKRDCPELKLILPSHALRRAVRRFIISRMSQLGSDLSRRWNARMGTTLYKWELMSLGADYDAVLYTDLDVNVMPESLNPATVGAMWARSLPSLICKPHGLSNCTRLIANPDWSSPVNAGFMLLLPPRELMLYQRGVAILHSPFNTSHGFNLSGSPKELLGLRLLRRYDGSVLMHAGKPANIDNTLWDFVGADVDQGFFLYMLHYYYDAGTYAGGRFAGYHIQHYWGGGPKPWHLVLRPRNAWNPKKGICHIDSLRAFNFLMKLSIGSLEGLQSA